MKIDELAFVRSNEQAIERYARQPLPTVRDLAAVLFRQRKPMLIAFALVIIALAVSGLWLPKYEAQMKFLVLRQRSDAMVTGSPNAPTQFGNDQISEEDINSEVQLLNSNDLLRKVVISTGLSGKSGSPGDPRTQAAIAAAVRKLGKDLKIEPIPKTNVISVSYESRDPKMADAVLKALAAAYLEKHRELHDPSGEFTFFNQQVQRYKLRLDQAQEKLTDFTKDTSVVSAQLQQDAALQQADDFESTARQAQTTMLETEQRVTALRAELHSIKPRIATTVRSSDNPYLLEQLKSTLLNLELKQTDLLTKFQPSYPLVQDVDQQIAEAKSAVNAAESKPLLDETSDQNPDYQWVQDELTKAQADLSGLKARAAAAAAMAAKYHAQAESLNQNMVLQDNLQQTVKTQEENYLLYERKREEARISNALNQDGIQNVALAEPPVVPALPKRSPLSMVLFSLLIAGAFSLSTGFAFDYLDPTFRTPDELSAYLDTPVLAALPRRGE